MKAVLIMGSRVGVTGMGLLLVSPAGEEEVGMMVVTVVAEVLETRSMKAGKAIRGRRLPMGAAERNGRGVVMEMGREYFPRGPLG